MPENEQQTAPGLHVVYGSRTRRGLSHPNEDRHAVAAWTEWNLDAHVQGDDGGQQQDKVATSSSYPTPRLTIPSCIGSARKDTTLGGFGSTGGARDSFVDLIANEQSSTGKEVDSSQNAFLWTVCDGHDGPEAADFVCRHVGEAFSKTWHTTGSHKIPAQVLAEKKFSSNDELKAYVRGYALSNALARTFESLDNAFRSQVWPEAQPGETQSRLPGSTAGACVTSIFLSGNMMCCAGLGDCKAAILTLEDSEPLVADSATTAQTTPSDGPPAKSTQQFQVTWFSKDHRSTCPKERARIRARGGWFRMHRVGGVLEPTRTIGDFDVKASQPPGVLIATPEVRTFTVTKPALVLIASDGVWDVMDASQLLRSLKKRRRLWRGILSWLGARIPERRSLLTFGFRRRAKSKEGLESILHLPTGGDLVAMAETLVTRAHDLGSDDDCTCLCLFLRPGESLSGPTESSVTASKQESSEGSDGDIAEEDEEEEEDLLLQEEEEFEEEDRPQDINRPLRHEREKSGGEEKWKQNDETEQEINNDDEEEVIEPPQIDAEDWSLPSATFPLSFHYQRKRREQEEMGGGGGDDDEETSRRSVEHP